MFYERDFQYDFFRLLFIPKPVRTSQASANETSSQYTLEDSVSFSSINFEAALMETAANSSPSEPSTVSSSLSRSSSRFITIIGGTAFVFEDGGDPDPRTSYQMDCSDNSFHTTFLYGTAATDASRQTSSSVSLQISSVFSLSRSVSALSSNGGHSLHSFLNGANGGGRLSGITTVVLLMGLLHRFLTAR